MMRSLFLGLALLLAVPLAPAAAQNPFSPAVTVNESAVTHYDIEQRMRLLEALGARGDLRALALEQLIEDRLKVQAGRELGIELPEDALLAGLEEFAATRGLTIDDVLRTLVARDIDRQTMDDFVESGIVWREVVQSRFRQRAQPSEADLDVALNLAANTPVEVLELSEIALPFEERGEEATAAFAEQLSSDLNRGAANFATAVRSFSRSGSAAQGGKLPPLPAQQLPPALRAQVLLLQPGRVTPPLPISGGLAILRLDAIRSVPREQAAEDLPDEEIRNQLREEIFLQRITSFGQGYLQELLSDALIIEQ
jgi:peptidyl-prolyl cis-trans isomerase SurA